MDSSEIHRLKRALKDKDINKVHEWANQYEKQIDEKYKRIYKSHLDDSLNLYELALVYTLRFGYSFGKGRLPDFMEDFFVTVDMFRTGEYSPEEYKDALEKAGVNINDEIITYRKRHPKGDLDDSNNV